MAGTSFQGGPLLVLSSPFLSRLAPSVDVAAAVFLMFTGGLAWLLLLTR